MHRWLHVNSNLHESFILIAITCSKSIGWRFLLSEQLAGVTGTWLPQKLTWRPISIIIRLLFKTIANAF